MANRKTRQKTKKKSKDLKLSTGRQNKKSMKLDKGEKLKYFSKEKRFQFLIENGHLIQDKILNKVAFKKGKLDKEALAKKPNKLISKGGKLKSRKKHTEYMDTILMSELLISRKPTGKHDSKSKPSSGDNNNDNGLSDQNNSVCLKDKSNEPENSEVSGDANINQIMVEVGPTSIGPNKTPFSSTDKDQTKAAKEANKNKSKQKRSKTKEIVAQRLQQLKEVKLSNGVTVSLKSYECDNCKFTFCSKASLQRHMLMHLNLKPLKCAHCPAAFRQRGNWRSHMARAHPEDFKKVKYTCRICKKTFQLKEHLKLHQRAHAKEKEKRYKCAFCEKDYKTQLLATQHEKQHMVPGRYKCSMCPMTYDSRSVYSAHLKSHAEMKDYACQFCGKRYLRPSSIARHIRVNHGGIRLQCPVCNKLLRGHLAEHMRTHENHRPHACDVCGQKFTQSTQLNVHMRSHTGIRPYLCRICNQPFSHSNALMLHIRRHTGEKPFECVMCPQTFSQLPHMKAHMRSIHRKTEYYKCDNCDSLFKFKSLLEAHAEECGGAVAVKQENIPEGVKDETLVTHIRFLLALLFTMIASKEKLYDLGFNKRLIDDILVDSIEAMGLVPTKDPSLPVLSRLRINALMLLQGTVPKHQMEVFIKQNKSTEEVLELLTDDHNKK